MACQDDQLCVRHKVIIDGSVHGVQYIWDKTLTTEYWEFLLVDANNVFNEINRIVMLWTVHHLWLSIARFLFNCYHHWSSLVFWNMNGTDSFVRSIEGVTQGDPMPMITYDIVILPLIKNLQQKLPDINQPCYTEDVGPLCTVTRVVTYFNYLTRQGPWRRYHTKPSKSILIVHPENLEAGKVFGARHVFKVWLGTRYLGVYIRYDEYKQDWLRERTSFWDNNIGTIGKISSWELRCGGMRDPIRVDIYTTRHLGHWGCVWGESRRWSRKTFFLIFSSEIQNTSHPS